MRNAIVHSETAGTRATGVLRVQSGLCVECDARALRARAFPCPTAWPSHPSLPPSARCPNVNCAKSTPQRRVYIYGLPVASVLRESITRTMLRCLSARPSNPSPFAIRNSVVLRNDGPIFTMLMDFVPVESLFLLHYANTNRTGVVIVQN